MTTSISVILFSFVAAIFIPAWAIADDRKPDLSPTVILTGNQRHVPLVVIQNDEKKYFSSATFALYFDEVIVDGKRVLPEVVQLPDIDMREGQTTDSRIAYVVNLNSLYCTHTKNADPYDFEIQFFPLPESFREVRIRFRPRISGALGPQFECQVLLKE